MPWYARKSINLGGGARMTFSKSGVSYSFGGRGYRATTGARGTYVTLGTGGVYYRQRVAESLYKGVSKYVSGLSGMKVASKLAAENKGE